MTSIKSFCFNAFQENTHVIYREGGDCVFIDPGNYTSEETAELTDFVVQNRLLPKMIVNTHCHVDHVLGVAALKKKYNIPFLIHPAEQATLESVKVYAEMYGFPAYEAAQADGSVQEGEILHVGDSSWEILFVPGHSPGHIALLERSRSVCIAGDILFLNSIGRTDLPGGDMDILLSGIKSKLYTLPDEVTVFPGHGPATTIGHEKNYNPFCKA